MIEELSEELPYLWRDAYLEITPRLTNIVRFRQETFEYVYDDYAVLEATAVVQASPDQDSRLVAALGRAAPRERKRDDSRLRGWVGRTERTFGPEWDKVHFIGHSIGGVVDGFELNIFVQQRSLNRG